MLFEGDFQGQGLRPVPQQGEAERKCDCLSRASALGPYKRGHGDIGALTALRRPSELGGLRMVDLLSWSNRKGRATRNTAAHAVVAACRAVVGSQSMTSELYGLASWEGNVAVLVPCFEKGLNYQDALMNSTKLLGPSVSRSRLLWKGDYQGSRIRFHTM